MVQLTLMDC